MSLKSELQYIAKNTNDYTLDVFVKEDDLYYSIYPIHAYIRSQFDLKVSKFLTKNTYHQPAYIKERLLSQINLKVRNHLLQFILVHELAVIEKAGLLDNKNGKSKLHQYIIITSDPEWIDYLFEKYKSLENRLEVYICNIFKHLKNILERIENNLLDIYTFLKIYPEKIRDITMFLGDQHQDGQSVTLIDFQSKKLLYKPRSQFLEFELIAFLNFLNDEGAGINIQIPKIVNYDSYSWTEFVANNEVDSLEDIKKFYVSQGKALALFYFLGSVDLIHENIIANGFIPSYIDLECILSKPFPIDRSSKFYNFFTESVVATGILPVLGVSNDLERDFFQGALHARAKDKVRIKMWENQSTADIDFVSKEVYLSNVEDEKHLPMHLGVRYEINEEYLHELIKGFRECYRFFITNKKLIVNYLESFSLFSKSHFRIIPHPTAVYDKIARNLLVPEAFENTKQQRDIKKILINTFGFNTKAINQRIAISILDQMSTGDVPYFFAKNDSRDLYNYKNEIVVPNFFQKTSTYEARFIKRIQEANFNDLELQEEIITGSIRFYFHLSRGKFLRDDPNQYLQFNSNKRTNNKILDSISLIADYLVTRSREIQGELNWLVKTTNTKDEKYEFAHMTYDIYEGLGGISFFLLYAFRYTKQERYFSLARQILQNGKDIFLKQKNYLLRYLNTPELKAANLSPYYYPSSLVFLMDHFSVFDKNAFDYDFLEHYYDYLERVVPFNENCDVLCGLSGLLELLMTLREKTPGNRLDNIIDKVLIQIQASAVDLDDNKSAWLFLRDSSAESTYFGGYAHGTAGIAVSLARAAKVLGQESLMQLASKALNYDRSLFNSDLELWVDQREKGSIRDSISWCHGSPGIGMSRILLSQYFNDNSFIEELRIAAKNTVSSKTESSCLCHGKSSDIEILKAYNSILKDPVIERKISSDISTLTEKLLSNSFQMIYGDGTKMEMIGLFLGLSGIGYLLLRIHDWKNMPSILCLESSGLNCGVMH